jgi:hypothetical protein
MHLGVFLRSNTLRRENTTLLRSDRSGPLFRGTFHGPTVIAHPSAREKRPGRKNRRGIYGPCTENRSGAVRNGTVPILDHVVLETSGCMGASFKCRVHER